ncbi:ACP S-malonyltransferase, partial [Actinospica durhamensis]
PDSPPVLDTGSEPDPGKLAFLFCGQGSQYPNMGADLAMTFPAAREAWDELSTGRFDGAQVPLHEIVFPRPAFTESEEGRQHDQLTATEWAQPALAAACVAQLRLVTRLGLRPDCVAGHSLGELVALHAAGCFDERTLIALARRRGELMRDASQCPGAMLALATDAKEAEAQIADHGDAWIANLNTPSQTVISGTVAAIEELERSAQAAGFATHRLAASTAFHSPLVASAATRLFAALDEAAISPPRLPVYATADANQYPHDPDEIRARVTAQLSAPVRFVDQIEAMYADGVRTFVEFGAGSVLTSLVTQILAPRPHLAVSLDRRGTDGVTSLHAALSRLSTHGVALPSDALANAAGYGPAADPDPVGSPVSRPESALTIELVGSNYARPYPPPGGEKELAMPNHSPEQLPAH